MWLLSYEMVKTMRHASMAATSSAGRIAAAGDGGIDSAFGQDFYLSACPNLPSHLGEGDRRVHLVQIVAAQIVRPGRQRAVDQCANHLSDDAQGGSLLCHRFGRQGRARPCIAGIAEGAHSGYGEPLQLLQDLPWRTGGAGIVPFDLTLRAFLRPPLVVPPSPRLSPALRGVSSGRVQ